MDRRRRSRRVRKNDRYPLHTALRAGCWQDIPDLLKDNPNLNLQDDKQCTPLLAALASPTTVANQLTVDIVQQLLSQVNVNMPDETGKSPLHWVVKKSLWDLVPILLNRGAYKDQKDIYGDVPLHIVLNHDSEVERSIPEGLLQQLISTGNVNLVNSSGQYPIFCAIENELWQIALVLLENGAYVNWLDENGDTVLHTAVGKSSMPLAVLQKVITPENVNRQNSDGQTAFGLLCLTENVPSSHIRNILLENGAESSLYDIIEALMQDECNFDLISLLVKHIGLPFTINRVSFSHGDVCINGRTMFNMDQRRVNLICKLIIETCLFDFGLAVDNCEEDFSEEEQDDESQMSSDDDSVSDDWSVGAEDDIDMFLLNKSDIEVNKRELEDHASRPPSLQKLSMICVRKRLTIKTDKNFKSLGLPNSLLPLVTLTWLADELRSTWTGYST